VGHEDCGASSWPGCHHAEERLARPLVPLTARPKPRPRALVAVGVSVAKRTTGLREYEKPGRRKRAGLSFGESARPDLNRPPPEPHSGALPGCATSRREPLR